MSRMVLAQIGVYFVLILLLTMGLLISYSGNAYDCKKAENWIWRARATNDLEDMSKYATNALEAMENLSGNPSWLFPAPDTDFDLIKTNIEEVIRNCGAITADMDTMAYQQAVNNLQETLVEIADHISLARYWLIWTPFNAIVLIIMCFIWIPLCFVPD